MKLIYVLPAMCVLSSLVTYMAITYLSSPSTYDCEATSKNESALVACIDKASGSHHKLSNNEIEKIVLWIKDDRENVFTTLSLYNGTDTYLTNVVVNISEGDLEGKGNPIVDSWNRGLNKDYQIKTAIPPLSFRYVSFLEKPGVYKNKQIAVIKASGKRID